MMDAMWCRQCASVYEVSLGVITLNPMDMQCAARTITTLENGRQKMMSTSIEADALGKKSVEFTATQQIH